jgi:hypothetical protein
LTHASKSWYPNDFLGGQVTSPTQQLAPALDVDARLTNIERDVNLLLNMTRQPDVLNITPPDHCALGAGSSFLQRKSRNASPRRREPLVQMGSRRR